MGTSRPIRLNLVTGELEFVAVPLLDEDEASVDPGANLLPRADGAGKLGAGWIPDLPIALLPVANSGEVSTTKVVRADDARLGNPLVGGDLSGTAANAAVIGLQGRDVAVQAPSDGNVLAWSTTNNRWEPQVPSSGTTLMVEEIDGAPQVNGVTTIRVSNGTLSNDGNGVVTLTTGGGGGSVSPGGVLYLFERFR